MWPRVRLKGWSQKCSHQLKLSFQYKRSSKHSLCAKHKHGIPRETQHLASISFCESCPESLGNSCSFSILVQRLPATYLFESPLKIEFRSFFDQPWKLSLECAIIITFRRLEKVSHLCGKQVRRLMTHSCPQLMMRLHGNKSVLNWKCRQPKVRPVHWTQWTPECSKTGHWSASCLPSWRCGW